MRAGSSGIVVRLEVTLEDLPLINRRACIACIVHIYIVTLHRHCLASRHMVAHHDYSLDCHELQAEVLLGEFWDPGSGAVFAEEGDQQRFWKLTRKFAENLVSLGEDGTRVRAVRSIHP